LIDQSPPVEAPTPPLDEIIDGCQGFMIRGMPVVVELPTITRRGDYLCYVPMQYQHFYIDLRSTFEIYKSKFSPKTRSTMGRKIRRFTEHCGGTMTRRSYRKPDEMREFFQHARTISKLTYQERLHNVGIPDSEAFMSWAERCAANDLIRAYVLFDRERPVSYLFCPVENDVLTYHYLGYDPDYMQHSVGSILQWSALEELFQEGRFRYFDFTEGMSDHKRLFATHQRPCANVFFVKRTVRNTMVIYSHLFISKGSTGIGEQLDRLGFKTRIRKFLRSRARMLSMLKTHSQTLRQQPRGENATIDT